MKGFWLLSGMILAMLMPVASAQESDAPVRICLGNGSEIHMGGNVRQAGPPVGVIMVAMLVMATHGATVPLGMVKLAPGQTIVDQDDAALYQAMTPLGNPGLASKTDFAVKTGGDFDGADCTL